MIMHSSKPYTEEDIARWRKLLSDPTLTNAIIASRLGCSTALVRRRRKELNIPLAQERQRNMSEEQKESIVTLYSKGRTITEISGILSIRYYTIHNFLSRRGLLLQKQTYAKPLHRVNYHQEYAAPGGDVIPVRRFNYRRWMDDLLDVHSKKKDMSVAQFKRWTNETREGRRYFLIETQNFGEDNLDKYYDTIYRRNYEEAA